MNKKTSIKPVSEIATITRKKYFPLQIPSNISCEHSSEQEFEKFVSKNFSKVFKNGFSSKVNIQKNTKSWRGLQSTILEYKKIHTEYFLFKQGNKTIGWCYGEMEDFETFYMRNTGILPQYQNHGIYQEFLCTFFKYLKELGYQKISGQHNLSNSRIISLKMKLGFIVVGTENHDRWGSLVKLVKFLDPKREKIFNETF